VSGDHLTTKVGGAPWGRSADLRADAVAYLKRSGNADVMEALGLDGANPEGPACPLCDTPLRAGRRVCLARGCEAGPAARGVKR
jgi:hypothetical protein